VYCRGRNLAEPSCKTNWGNINISLPEMACDSDLGELGNYMLASSQMPFQVCLAVVLSSPWAFGPLMGMKARF